jgi:hypothetical protein
MRHMSVKLVMLLVAASTTLAVTPATADNIAIDTIYFTGLKLTFAAGEITAAPSEADAISFVKNKIEVDYLEEDVDAHVLIKGVPGIPPNSQTAVSTSGESGSYIDLLESSTTLLHLPVDQLNVRYTNVPGTQSVTLSGIISGTITQNLSSHGLTINPGDAVSVQLVADQLGSLSTSGGLLTGFQSANGTAHITFIPVPEPASLMILLSLAASSLAAGAWRVATHTHPTLK